MSLDLYFDDPFVRAACKPGEYVEHVYQANITHNLNRMAGAVGLYTWLWRPEEEHVTRAGELTWPLFLGIATLLADPERFDRLSADNGWGTYDQFLPWLIEVYRATLRYPDATR